MKYLPVLLIALMSIGCASKLTEEQKSQITKEVEATVRNFMNAGNVNYDSYLALRAARDGYIFAGDGKIQITDYKAFPELIRKAFEGVDRFIEMEVNKIYTYVLSEDAAASTMEFKSRFITKGGDTLTDNGCWTMVFTKLDGSWKVIQENGTHTK